MLKLGYHTRQALQNARRRGNRLNQLTINFNKKILQMHSLYFEQVLEPARAIALTELFENFEKHKKIKNRSDANNIKKAFALLIECFPNISTSEFSALKFLEFQEFLVLRGYARKYCNKLANFVRSVFYWGEMFSLVSPMLAYQLKKVPAIKYGDAKENPDREAVPVEAVQYALAYFPATIADMLRLQLLTAMRPSEIRLMLVGYIRQKYDGENWLYLPPAHKTAWRGKKKAIVLGVEEQEILRKYIQDKPSDKPIFLNSRGNPYTASRYSTIVRKTIAKYDLVKFIPYQLRHTSLTQISVEHGKDAARAVAGHSSEVVTSIYDHSDVQKAQKVVNARNARYRQVGSVQVGSVQELPVVPFLRIFKGGDQL